MTEELRREVQQALARAYCTDVNKNKVLDPDLIHAMTDVLAPLFALASLLGELKGADTMLKIKQHPIVHDKKTGEVKITVHDQNLNDLLYLESLRKQIEEASK